MSSQRNRGAASHGGEGTEMLIERTAVQRAEQKELMWGTERKPAKAAAVGTRWLRQEAGEGDRLHTAS